MKAIKTVPDRKALETGFLILSILPRRTTTVDTIKDAAKRIAGLRMSIVHATDYERCAAARDDESYDWKALLRGYMSLQAPGMDAGLMVPEYPMMQSVDVNRCDLMRLSEAFWYGAGQVRSTDQNVQDREVDKLRA